MSIFTKFFQLVKKSYYYIGKIFGGEMPPPIQADYLDAFETCDIAFRCIHLLCSKVANTNLHLYQMGTQEEIEEIFDHDVLDLLARPNPHTTKWELFYQIELSKILTGNAYVLKLRSRKTGKGLIQELWLLRPDWVTVKVNDDGSLSYEYRMPNQVKTYSEKDIIHIKMPSIKSAIYGSPLIKPIINIIRNYVYSVRWNTKFFYNEARPDALIVSKTRIPDAEKEEIRRKWKEMFGFDSGGTHGIGFLSGEGIDYKIVSSTIKDMDFANLLKVSREDIMLGFGVPKPLLMPEAGNKSTIDGAIYIFYNDTIKPEIQMIVDKLNEFLVISDFGENLWLDYDNPVPEDVELKLKVYENALRNNWMVINEVRDKEGLPPLEGGWNWYMPLTVVSGGTYEKEKMIGGYANKEEYEKLKKEKWQKEMKAKFLNGRRGLKISQKTRKELAAKIKEILNVESEEEKTMKYWLDCDTSTKAKSDEMLGLLKTEFNKQKNRVLKKLREKIKDFKGLADDVFDLDKEKGIFEKFAVPFFTITIGKAGEEALRRIGAEITFQMTNEVLKWIEKRAELFAKSVNETTFDKLKETLAEGYAQGEGYDKLAERVKGVYGDIEEWRAKTISWTETHGAVNEANLSAFEQAGFKKHKWIHTRIGEPRETHLAAEGQVVNIGEYFDIGGKKTLAPGLFGDPEEDINCHCQTQPIE